MSLPSHDRIPTKVSIVLRDDTLNPDFWSDYFGIQADFSARKGEITRTPKGNLRVAPHLWGVWNYQCKSTSLASIDEGVLILIKALKFPRADFRQVLAAHGCEAILGIFVDNSDGRNPPLYGKVTQDFIDHTGADLSLTVVDPYSDDPK